MELREAVAAFGIPAKIITRMEKEGLICIPLDDAGVNALSVISRLMSQTWFLAESLRGIKARERTMLLLFPDYNKIDRYILNTFLNLPVVKNLPTEVMKYRVKLAYSANVDENRIRKLREVAVNIRLKQKKFVLGKLSLTYADILGIRWEETG